MFCAQLVGKAVSGPIDKALSVRQPSVSSSLCGLQRVLTIQPVSFAALEHDCQWRRLEVAIGRVPLPDGHFGDDERFSGCIQSFTDARSRELFRRLWLLYAVENPDALDLLESISWQQELTELVKAEKLADLVM